jgi:uncharacterized damage-inducible protein DinB
MTVAELQRLFDYAYWANRRLFATLAQLTDEQLTHTVAGTYGSIRNTLVHMLSAEWGWLDRCGGAPRGPALKPEDFPTLQSITDVWDRVEADVRAFLGGLTDADLDRVVEFTMAQGRGRGMLGQLMHHGAVHGIHHRGQVALLVRMLGHAPGNFDVLFYDFEKHPLASV